MMSPPPEGHYTMFLDANAMNGARIVVPPPVRRSAV